VGAIGMRISHGEAVDYVILPRDGADREARFFGIAFRGAALWLRTDRGRPLGCRALKAYEVRSESLGLSMEADATSHRDGWRWVAPSSS
ncbi:MAG: hypothetical protein ACREJC_12360, partial [Tepidisphaeraceae bacterium]